MTLFSGKKKKIAFWYKISAWSWTFGSGSRKRCNCTASDFPWRLFAWNQQRTLIDSCQDKISCVYKKGLTLFWNVIDKELNGKSGDGERVRVWCDRLMLLRLSLWSSAFQRAGGFRMQVALSSASFYPSFFVLHFTKSHSLSPSFCALIFMFSCLTGLNSLHVCVVAATLSLFLSALLYFSLSVVSSGES